LASKTTLSLKYYFGLYFPVLQEKQGEESVHRKESFSHFSVTRHCERLFAKQSPSQVVEIASAEKLPRNDE